MTVALRFLLSLRSLGAAVPLLPTIIIEDCLSCMRGGTVEGQELWWQPASVLDASVRPLS
jgi:hypothetical protein